MAFKLENNVVRFLTKDDCDEVLHFCSGGKKKGKFSHPGNEEEFSRFITAPNAMVGMYNDNKLVALATLLVPDEFETDYSGSLLVYGKNELRSANFYCRATGTATKMSAQKILLAVAVEYARCQGINVLCAITMPDNVTRQLELERLGFRLNREITTPGGQKKMLYYNLLL